MRILQVIKRFDFGGAENYVQELSSELASQGHDVTILGRRGRQCAMLSDKVTFIDAKFYFGAIACVFIIVRLVKRYNIDVIHAHQRMPILSASIASLLTGVPVVATIHGRVRYDLRSYISRKIPAYFIFVSHQVFMVSRYRNMLMSRSVVVPNGIKVVGPPHRLIPFSIGYMSRIDLKHAGLIGQLADVVPLLCAEFGRISLFIYGDGDEIESIRRKAEKINSDIGYNAIIVGGYVAEINAMDQYPELVVGVGRVAIEAAHKGCGVIPVNSRRMGKLLTLDNYQFYCDNNFVDIEAEPPTPQLLYNALAGYFRNREMYDNAAIARKIETDYDIVKIAETIVELYISTCDGVI